jgi:hypothetical protein
VFDTRTEMLCEAASGYFDSKPDEPRAYRLLARSIEALGGLGFLDRRLGKQFSDLV